MSMISVACASRQTPINEGGLRRVRLFALAVLGLAAGCGDSDTALDLELVQDLNLNTPEQVAARVNTLRVVVDSDQGLYGPGDGQSGPNFRIENVDSDPAFEFVVETAVGGSALPTIRVARGGLPRGLFDVRLLGLGVGPQPIATGGIAGVGFQEGDTRRLPVQFNLRSQFLPPRVLESYPGLGEETCRSGLALLILSKPLEAETVVGGDNVVVERLDTGESLSVTLDVDGPLIRIAFGDVPEARAHYRISLQGDVRDDDGIMLDQDPGRPGAQAFVTDFFVEPDAGCSDYPWRWCHEEAAVLECPDFRSGRLRCDQGLCVPDSCLESSCAAGYVCETSSAICVVDCRIYGDFGGCAEGLSCDADSGRCL